MILTAHQPVYLPWLGLFHKILLSDLFCVFDIVQYQKRDYNNRNKIKTMCGAKWLSVPVKSKNHFQTKLCDVKIINGNWGRKHARAIEINYGKAPYFRDYFESITKFLVSEKYKFLTDLTTDMLRM